MPVYVKYDTIKGDVTAEGHEDWIQVHSFSWGSARTISTPVGAASDRESSTPSVSEIMVSKDVDKASTFLLQEALYGKKGKDVTIDFCKTDDQPEPYLTYTLTNSLISNYQLSSGGDRPSESLSFNFTEVQCRDVGMGATNDDGTPASTGYSLTKAKKA